MCRNFNSKYDRYVEQEVGRTVEGADVFYITIFVLAEIGGINFVQATRSNNFTFSTTTEGLIKENFMFVSFPHSEQVETSSVLLTDIDGSVLFM